MGPHEPNALYILKQAWLSGTHKRALLFNSIVVLLQKAKLRWVTSVREREARASRFPTFFFWIGWGYLKTMHLILPHLVPCWTTFFELHSSKLLREFIKEIITWGLFLNSLKMAFETLLLLVFQAVLRIHAKSYLNLMLRVVLFSWQTPPGTSFSMWMPD